MANSVFTLSTEFRQVLDMLEKEHKNLFITGKAGTGKSTLLQLFRHTTKKKLVILAPTGVAALNVGGQTIHSFFGFPSQPLQKQDIKKKRDVRVFKAMEVLIIDEISMVRADMLDNIDYALRINRGNPEPFGGLQVVFFGDLFQLPPIVQQEEAHFFQSVYATPYFFSAKVISEKSMLKEMSFDFEMFELSKVYRQEARHFIRLLDAVRMGQADEDDLQDLNERHETDTQKYQQEGYITLSTRNAIVDKINFQELGQLQTLEYEFKATIEGIFDPKQYPTEPLLKLKQDSQVIFLRNDPDGDYVNGTIGKIMLLTKDRIVVKTEGTKNQSPKTIEVVPQKWEILRYEVTYDEKIKTEVVGSFTQYPLRLAWAITIHKSQGKTFDKVVIDLGSGAFECGQTYVALSRCRTLEGIVLKKPINPRDVWADEKVVDFYNRAIG